jgi:hypothetical protein
MEKLKHTEGRIIIKMDMEYKNSVTFSDGTKIRLERKYDCFDQKHTQPVNAIVVSADGIPEDSEIIVHHNCTHETGRIHNYQPLSGKVEASDVRYFSILEDEAFAWYDEVNSKWMPLKGFDFALQIFKPYKGILEGIEPAPIKNCLWVTTGEYAGNACMTLQASNYKMIFQDRNGREKNIIRFRSEEDLKTQRELEIVCLHHSYTKQVLNGDLHVGLTISDAKPLKEYIHA